MVSFSLSYCNKTTRLHSFSLIVWTLIAGNIFWKVIVISLRMLLRIIKVVDDHQRWKFKSAARIARSSLHLPHRTRQGVLLNLERKRGATRNTSHPQVNCCLRLRKHQHVSHAQKGQRHLCNPLEPHVFFLSTSLPYAAA